MTTTEDIKTLTPEQFKVARALAGEYGHLWAGVPDETYEIEAIRAYSAEEQSENLPDGIYFPWLVDDHVMHTTGTGRLSWTIFQSGNTMLEVNRPKNTLVIRVNMIKDDAPFFDIETDLSFYAGFRHLHDDPNPAVDYGQDLSTDFSTRHVAALIKPLTTLLMIGKTSKDFGYADDDTDDQHCGKYYALVNSIRDQVKVALKTLFDLALPDPYDDSELSESYMGYLSEDRKVRPATYWSRQDNFHFPRGYMMEVVHNSERLYVESEKTAVHAVLLLREYPDMAISDAVQVAIHESQYRLHNVCQYCGTTIRPQPRVLRYCEPHNTEEKREDEFRKYTESISEE
jgi:hypothetical protein